MGHLTLIAEEVLKLAERIPLDLLDSAVVQKLTAAEWNDYVDVTLTATRTRDNAILGGVRPQPSGLTPGLNSTGLGSTAADMANMEENAVLAAIVHRGLSYENGDPQPGDDEFEDDQEEREVQDGPVSVLCFFTMLNNISSFGTCHKVFRTTCRIDLEAQMKMMMMRKLSGGWARQANLKQEPGYTTRMRTTLKLDRTLVEEDYSKIDGKVTSKMMMTLDSTDQIQESRVRNMKPWYILL